ncbi:hypothetical protein CROQUDRAFT_109509 [Cronartium quercuum f. sp. fusiforme G11]|uniref:Disintegrin and metalloproteinase domain-containing protein B n=1 Tax=Cronartium quercuum f. sp. fusiforme G11 TaxID=708437 RepID=A0A9P6T9V9_9BASI|nr:hypothetical protein CROQUDRAFT_109509 [Cronartium quercuum f. sp. fusiforme G11]
MHFYHYFIIINVLHNLLPHQIIHAHSIRSPPIQFTHQIQSASLQILPRHQQTYPPNPILKRSSISPLPSNLIHNDSILLRFSVSSTHFSLSLRPTPNLIHPNATIKYHTVDPTTGITTIETKSLLPEDVLAYTGWVIDESHINDWWSEELSSVERTPDWSSTYSDKRVLGWARILIHDTSKMSNENDLNQLSWEGSFEVNGEVWNVKPIDNFIKTKGFKDFNPIPIHSHHRGGLIAWKESQSNDFIHDENFTQNYQNSNSTQTCGHDQLDFNVDPLHEVYQSTSQQQDQQLYFSPPFNRLPTITNFMQSILGTIPTYRPINLVKRQSSDISGLGNMSSNFASSIGLTTGCPIGPKVVFIGVAADCTYVNKHGNQDSARTSILNNINSASALYLKTFNVSIGVVELNVQSPICPITPQNDLPWNVGCPESGPNGLDLNQRLSVFSQWRGKKGGSDGAGLWHLMTNCSSGTEVGVAWLGQLCQVDSVDGKNGQITSGTGVTASSSNEWAVMAHEIGHNFGAIHDCVSGCSLTEACCPLEASSCDTNSHYLMAPVSTKNASVFSPCSIGNICTTLRDSVNTTCLVTPGQRSVISLQQCGNGIVEPGEDCDPGENQSKCCDSKTCKFSSGSKCDPTNGGCCTADCQFSDSNSICRQAIDKQCDFPEKCTGNSSICPTDTFAQDGKSCGTSDGLSCASGVCTSRDQQCSLHGTSLGLKKACPASATSTCQIACVDPTGRADCILLTNNFIDGTECGYGGRCKQGKCQQGSVLDTAKGWFLSNLSIGIPIVIAAGILALLMIFSILRCLINSFKPRIKPIYPGPSLPRHQSVVPKPEDAVQEQPVQPIHFPPPPPPHSQGPTRTNWVDPTAWNGRP